MTGTSTLPPPSAGRAAGRMVGRVRGERSGPRLILLGGIHGNEPAGLQGAARVLERLDALRGHLCGEVVLLAGNLAALSAGRRFIDRDLNRQWTGGPSGRGGSEDREMGELRAQLDELLREFPADRTIFLDLHTTSGDGSPFVTIGDTLRNRALAWHFPVPVILGLEEQVDGALLEHLNDRGLLTMGIEGGRHDAPSTVDNHESLLWIALAAAGMLPDAAVPDLAERRARLRALAPGIRRFVEVFHRHVVTAGDRFVMEPGFRNLDPVRKGQLLARDRRGEIRSPVDARVLLPLYQSQGDDGFFLCRDVRTFWLLLSATLRRMRLGTAMPLLPGVRREPGAPETLRVDTRVAHWFPLQIFHLLGYRKLRRDGPVLLVSRRRHDLR